jgi:hypothetical protein
MGRVLSPHRTTPRHEQPRLTDLARRKLEQHPHFHGHTNDVHIAQRGTTLCLTGRLPSFYLKQLVQEALLRLPGVREIDNGIDVVNPAGVSSVRYGQDPFADGPQW